jgi:hypothetical protein
MNNTTILVPCIYTVAAPAMLPHSPHKVSCGGVAVAVSMLTNPSPTLRHVPWLVGPFIALLRSFINYVKNE